MYHRHVVPYPVPMLAISAHVTDRARRWRRNHSGPPLKVILKMKYTNEARGGACVEGDFTFKGGKNCLFFFYLKCLNCLWKAAGTVVVTKLLLI